jgi:FAD/FMN-containing dehydrogenase
VLVTSSQEVSLVVCFASRHYIPLVVQGGGYSTSGASSTHGGIIIALSAMRKVLVDRASETVAVQGGATWEDVDRAAACEGLAVVGCTSSAVGVGARLWAEDSAGLQDATV